MNEKFNNQYVSCGGVRGLAIIYVSLIYRYILLLGCPFPNLPKTLYRLIWDGYLMVDLFFFLSGFFSCTKYAELINNKSITFTEYFTKKVHKLFPLMIFTAIITTIIQLFGVYLIGNSGFQNELSISGLLLSCLGLQSGWFNDGGIYSNPVGWYLCIMLIDYVVFYPICMIKNEKIRKVLFIIWTLIGCAVMLHPFDSIGAYASNGRGYFGFGYGVIFSCLYNSRGERKRYLRILISTLILVSCILVWVLKPAYIGNKNIVIVMLVCPAIMVLASESFIIKRFLSTKILLLLGRMSLHIFLWSFPVDILIKILLNYSGNITQITTVRMWTVSSLLIIGVAYISYRWLNEALTNIFKRAIRIFE